jgi:hypothetical protein
MDQKSALVYCSLFCHARCSRESQRKRHTHYSWCVELTSAQVLAWRLRQQHLEQRAHASALLDVADRLCGLHAQVMSSAELTLWARIDDLAPDAVQHALWNSRDLVKSWMMRGTLHLVPSRSYPIVQGAVSLYRHYQTPVWLRSFETTQEELETLIHAVHDALADEPLTRTALADRVTELTGSADLGDKLTHSWGAMLKPAAFRGHLCFGPNLGQQVRFTRPDRWLAKWQGVDPSTARFELTRRYLGAYGPVPEKQFGMWLGLSPAKARGVLIGLGDEVAQVPIDGERRWLLAKDLADMRNAALSGLVRLVPGFDQYVVGAPRDDPAVLPPAFKTRVHRPQGWISPVVLVDGRMDGVWRHERKGSRVLVQVEPFVEIGPPVRRAVESEAERLAAFLDGRLELSWSD